MVRSAPVVACSTGWGAGNAAAAVQVVPVFAVDVRWAQDVGQEERMVLFGSLQHCLLSLLRRAWFLCALCMMIVHAVKRKGGAGA